MSDEFEFDELDSGILLELDALEASAPAIPPPKATPPVEPSAAERRAARVARIERELNSNSNSTPTVKKTSTIKPVPAPATRITIPDNDDPIEVFDSSRKSNPAPTRPSAVAAGVSFSSDTFDDTDDFFIDEAALREIDRVVEAATSNKAGLNKLTQTTLAGEILAPRATANTTSFSTSRATFSRTKSTSSSGGGSGRQSMKTKKWDHTAFAKTGLKPIAKSKGKAAVPLEDGEDEAEEFDLSQIPDALIPDGYGFMLSLFLAAVLMPPHAKRIFYNRPPPPMQIHCDRNAAREWIYPLNHPKRDYQFNIVRKALFENTLVALPTGLGKTFVAGVVMLNYYRWFPEGKIVFLAPTKPLVAQQIEASHQTCGIPGSDAAELTGQLQPAARSRLWDSKRVFYMTPQTFMNDIAKNELVSPSSIILIVVDEAHRATGDYAYCTAVRYMMAKNPHFRILALTATPGSNAQAVQAIVDSMRISHIEIRDEGALDLRDYVHKKHMVQHVVEMPPEFAKVRDQIVKVMEKVYVPLGHILPGADMRTMSEFRPTMKRRELGARDRWASQGLYVLGSLARAMSYLLTESIEMCYDTLQELANGTTDADGKKIKKANLPNEPIFRALIRDLEGLRIAAAAQASAGRMVHPKIDKLTMLLIQHFANEIGDGGPTAEMRGNDPAKGSKVMVFASYRQAVEQIVEELNRENPIIRAHRFIGQAASKEGIKGLRQKEQLEVIERFKKGEFNTLVCTSIGEEGLDIGEVDLIVCYDSHKAPIKMLQRIGRTGRKKDGHIAVLVAEGKEEENFQKAKEAYADVQRVIFRGDQLELYGDVERLVPDDIKPQVREKVMEIEGYVKETKRKRNDGQPKSVPAGGLDGFLSAKQLKNGSTSKPMKKTTMPRKIPNPLAHLDAIPDDSEDEDDDLDADAHLAAHINQPPAKKPRISLSDKESSKTSKAKKKSKGKEEEGEEEGKRKRKRKEKKKKAVVSPTISRVKPLSARNGSHGFRSGRDLLDLMPVDRSSEDDRSQSRSQLIPSSSNDSDDSIEILATTLARRSQSSSPGIPSPSFSSSPERPLIGLQPKLDVAKRKQPQSSPEPPANTNHWLLDSDSDEEQILPIAPAHRSPSPPVRRPFEHAPRLSNTFTRRLVTNMGPPSAPPCVDRNIIDLDTSTEQVDSPFPIRVPGRRPTVSKNPRILNGDDDVMEIDTSAEIVVGGSSPAVRPPRRRRRIVAASSPEPDNVPPPSSQRRSPRMPSPSPPPAQTEHRPRPRIPVWDKPNALVAMEAEHSGDDVSAGDTDSEGVEDDYDREFIAPGDTQSPDGYDQDAVYRQGLLTQAPASLNFHSKPVRTGIFGSDKTFGRDRPGAIGRQAGPSSSPRANESDDYDLDSFVVEDEDISFLSES